VLFLSRYLGMWLDSTTSHRQTWLFSSTLTYHSTDLLTARGVAHLVFHGTSGLISYETIPHVRLESSGGVLSTVDMVVQRRDGPRWLRELDVDDDDVLIPHSHKIIPIPSHSQSNIAFPFLSPFYSNIFTPIPSRFSRSHYQQQL